MPTYKLTYFNTMGRAEAIRLLLALAGEKFEDVRYTFDEYPKAQPAVAAKSVTGQMPILEVGDEKDGGGVITQSVAIYRYLARKYDLYGKGLWEQAQGDRIVDTILDMANPVIGAIFFSKDDAEKEERLKKCNETVPSKLAALEKLVAGPFFLKSGLSWVDVVFLAFFQYVGFAKVELSPSKYPKLKNVLDKVNANPRIAAWIKSRPQTAL